MSIGIDLNSLKKFWYLPGGHLRFLVKADFGPHEPELADLIETSAEIRDQLAGSGNNADAEGWVRTKNGWGGVLIDAFTIDHGTASTAAALMAEVGGRMRLLAAAAQPAGAPLEPLLAGLVDDIRRAEPDLRSHLAVDDERTIDQRGIDEEAAIIDRRLEQAPVAIGDADALSESSVGQRGANGLVTLE